MGRNPARMGDRFAQGCDVECDPLGASVKGKFYSRCGWTCKLVRCQSGQILGELAVKVLCSRGQLRKSECLWTKKKARSFERALEGCGVMPR